MGNSQSLFYPDNPKRRDRAQQLASDCKSFVDEYNNKHQALEDDLGVYKDKVMQVLAAFGCSTIDDLDEVVQQNATGQALKDWDVVKGEYDRAQVVDQVIMAVMGVVAIAGLSISAIGALAGGFGFFAGIAVTSDILLVLGAIGAIFDIVEGAILRSKLRDSINKLFTDRIKCKRVLNHIDNLTTWIPTIHILYKSFEDCGYNKDVIIELLRKDGIMKPMQDDLKAETFYAAAQELNDMDVRRESWTNEDPNWQTTASSLDTVDFVATIKDQFAILDHQLTGSGSGSSTYTMSRSINPVKSKKKTHDSDVNIDIDEEIILPPPPPYEKAIRVVLAADMPGPLQQPLHISLHSFVDPGSARVHIHTDDGHLLGVNGDGALVESAKSKVQWTISLANEAVIPRFGPQAESDLSNVELEILISCTDGFVGRDGRLVKNVEESAVMRAKYFRD